LDFLEREVVAGLMEGVSVEDIAGRLGVSASTLKGAMETARQKIAGRREQAA
jgi:DNA-directed RNA polymerase specialized sigma24 family protein